MGGRKAVPTTAAATVIRAMFGKWTNLLSMTYIPR